MLTHEVSLEGELTFTPFFYTKIWKYFYEGCIRDGKFLDEKFASHYVAHVSINVALLKTIGVC